VQDYLSYLAKEKNVASSTQDQALNAILFFYKYVMKQELGLIDAIRAKRPKRLPVVLTQEEIKRLLSHLSGIKSLMVRLLYGGGLRLMECLGRIGEQAQSADQPTAACKRYRF